MQKSRGNGNRSCIFRGIFTLFFSFSAPCGQRLRCRAGNFVYAITLRETADV